MEEDYIQQICEEIIRLKPDLVFTEKGISGINEPSHNCLLMRRDVGEIRMGVSYLGFVLSL